MVRLYHARYKNHGGYEGARGDKTSGLNCRITRDLFAFHRIRITSIISRLSLQRMPSRGNGSGQMLRFILQLLNSLKY